MTPKQHAGIGGNTAVPNPDQESTDKEQEEKGKAEQAERDKNKAPTTPAKTANKP
jgi:hypothetical protein